MSCRDVSHACGGLCCESFFMNVRPERLGELYSEATARVWAFEDSPYWWEVLYVGEMLLRVDEPDECAPRYSCAHYDRIAGLCKHYAQRPTMCREYPYGRPCEICHFTPAVEGLVSSSLHKELPCL